MPIYEYFNPNPKTYTTRKYSTYINLLEMFISLTLVNHSSGRYYWRVFKILCNYTWQDIPTSISSVFVIVIVREESSVISFFKHGKCSWRLVTRFKRQTNIII